MQTWRGCDCACVQQQGSAMPADAVVVSWMPTDDASRGLFCLAYSSKNDSYARSLIECRAAN